WSSGEPVVYTNWAGAPSVDIYAKYVAINSSANPQPGKWANWESGYHDSYATWASAVIELPTLPGPTPPFDWACFIDGPYSSTSMEVMADDQGKVYATGPFYGIPSLSSNNIFSAGSGPFYAFKLNSAGQVLWGQEAGNSGAAGEGITSDNAGN